MHRLSPFLMVLGCLPVCAQQTHWIGTWGASASPQLASGAQMLAGHLLFNDQTVRQVVHTSAAGTAVRVRLSNAYGREGATIGAAHLALRDKVSSTVASSDHALTFSGRSSVTIPADATVLSDPIAMDLPAYSDVVITLYLPKPTAAGGIHYAAQQTTFIGSGDQTATADSMRQVRSPRGCS